MSADVDLTTKFFSDLPGTSFSSRESEVFDQLLSKLERTERRLSTAEQRLQVSELRVQQLEQKLRLRLIEKYGPGSEKLTVEQLQLLEQEPGVSNQEVAAESQREAQPQVSSSSPKPKQPKPHPGRQTFPEHLRREEKIIPCPPEQCVCQNCGGETKVIGYEVSEQLELKPAELFVRETKREKRACKKGCEQAGVKTAPVPERIIEKGLAGDSVVINAVISKYLDHVPLYRQSVILEREAGVDLSRATLDGWIMKVGESLEAIVSSMRRALVEGSYIQADETPVPVQMQDGRGSNKQAYLWQYSRPGGEVIFDFRLGRGREGPEAFLKQFDGILQTDGYAAYDQVGAKNVVRAGCWSHCRRKFFDAVKVNPQDKIAVGIIAKIDALFAVDADAREQDMNLLARHELRQQRAGPQLDEIKRDMVAAGKSALPQSLLGKAIHYALSRWDKLIRFLDYPELELSTNVLENSMRPVALGRRNWLHFGSPQAGPKIAAILSIVETCRRMDIPVRDYLEDILPKVNNFPINRIHELTPKSWTAKQHADIPAAEPVSA